MSQQSTTTSDDQSDEIRSTEVDTTMSSRPKKSVVQIIINFLSGYFLATITLVNLALLVWFSTLEQTVFGLTATAEKYYQPSPAFVFPLIDTPFGRSVQFPIPLLGAYWTCVILFINMTLGGIIRIRKNIKQIGPIIAHFGIILLLVAGFVDHHQSIHGHMDTRQFGSYDYAWKRGKTSLEIFEFDEKQDKKPPYVIKHDMLEDLEFNSSSPKKRTFKINEFPFDIEVKHFIKNATLVIDNRMPQSEDAGPVVDGLFLIEEEIDPTKDLYYFSCYVTIRPHDGSPSRDLILSRRIDHPLTFSVAGKLYGIEMPNEIWKMPYDIELVNSFGEFYPGTQLPSHYSSDIIWKDDQDVAHERTIKMNEPLRHKGYTLYQASWTPPTNGIEYSGFVIVTNPSDQWPLYCLWISAFGLCVHFLMKFITYMQREQRKSIKNKLSKSNTL